MRRCFLSIINLICTIIALANVGDASVVRVLHSHPGGVISVEQLSDLSFRLTATPNAGYTFLKWSDGDLNAQKIYTHIADPSKDATLWAVFTKNADMTFEDGDVTADIVDNKTMQYSLTVTPHENVSFRRWDNGMSTTTINYFESDGNRRPYFINLLGSVTITVDGHPGGNISYSNTSGFTYNLSALRNSGYSFLQWADDGEATSTRTYTHPADFSRDTTLYAVFTRDVDLTQKDGHINVSVDNVKIPTFQLSAEPNPDAVFRIWDDGNTNAVISYRESDGNRKPFFINTNGSISVFYVDHPGGHVFVEPITGLQYRLIARPADGYDFISWLDGTTDSIITHTHTKGGDDAAYDAVFAKRSDINRNYGHSEVSILDSSIPNFSLHAVADPDAIFKSWDNGVNEDVITYEESDGTRLPFFTSSLGIVNYRIFNHPGGNVEVIRNSRNAFTLNAVPKPGYSFLQWLDGGMVNPRTYTHAMSFALDSAISAVFTKTEDVIQTGGTTSVSVKNYFLPSFTLLANPNTDCATFYKWTNGSADLSQTYLETDENLIPVFSHGANAVKYSKETNPGGQVNITPLSCGFTIEAVPDEGYHFIKWEDDASISTVLRDVDYAPGEYAAHFGKSAYKVDNVVYATFEDAVNAAGGTKSIVLIDDVDDNVIINSSVLIDGDNHIIRDLTIALGGNLTINGPLEVNNLYLNATTGQSSQLRNYSGNLNVNNKVYIDIKLEATESEASPDKWYGLSVPFDVDVESGIKRASGNGSHISGTDYLVWEYNGNLRANTGNGWEKMLGGTMHAGRFYMIGIDGNENVWRFTKNDGAPLGGSSCVALEEFPGDIKNQGWNAVGNTTLEYVHASVSGAGEDIEYCQVYNNKLSKYDVKRFDMTSFVMACPFFVQVDNAGKELSLMSSNETNADNLYAPQRTSILGGFVCELRLSRDNVYDALFISSSEFGTDSYEVGKDVAKIMGASNTHYIWANAYGSILCAQDMRYDDSAPMDYQISLFAPQEGDYILSASNISYDVWLIKDGITMADLSTPISLHLNKGVSKFIVRVGAMHSLPTRLDPMDVSTSPGKVIKDGILYIYYGSNIYDAQGQKIK